MPAPTRPPAASFAETVARGPDHRARDGSPPATPGSTDVLDDTVASLPDARDATARDAGRNPTTPGVRVGRFEVTRTLGAGGMGVVYAAHDPELDREVALKLIRGERDEAARIRLHREAQALAKLTHPNVVAVYDVGTHDGQVWIAMEFVVGRTLGAWIKHTRPRWRQVLAVIKQAARGLAAAHAEGLLHRDIKPDNIMVTLSTALAR
ncbi:MAG: serine/threonine protein kinase [Myxococcales bacterium]|nr:serine/threonine protein kinase [Myxococcales bacterium]MCB9749603.1 serine/threonine protein kinase [Myxococcales bacterium]